MRMKGQDGFTLVELMITMVIFVLAIAAASNIFSGLLNQFKQQSSIAETNIEGISGLELMRHDLEQAGFGLPWNLNNATYTEAADVKYDPTLDTTVFGRLASAYNDAAGNVPRAVVVGNNVLMNGSDVLVVRATNIATDAASQKWEYIVNNGALPNDLRVWDGSPAEQLNYTDHVIIINPAVGANNQRVLVNSGGSFDTQLSGRGFSFPPDNSGTTSAFEPPMNSYTAYIAYGVSSGSLRMPFSRADFYLKTPADIPTRCAPGTGVLYKATINQADGKLTELPLLDCVLDMQIVVALDKSGSGSATVHEGLPIDGAVLPASLTAQQVRDQLKEIRVYLIVQEGQKDISYTYVNPDPAAPVSEKDMVYVIDPNLGNVYGDAKNGYTVPDLNYRWKLHTIVVTPYNLK